MVPPDARMREILRIANWIILKYAQSAYFTTWHVWDFIAENQSLDPPAQLSKYLDEMKKPKEPLVGTTIDISHYIAEELRSKFTNTPTLAADAGGVHLMAGYRRRDRDVADGPFKEGVEEDEESTEECDPDASDENTTLMPHVIAAVHFRDSILIIDALSHPTAFLLRDEESFICRKQIDMNGDVFALHYHLTNKFRPDGQPAVIVGWYYEEPWDYVMKGWQELYTITYPEAVERISFADAKRKKNFEDTYGKGDGWKTQLPRDANTKHINFEEGYQTNLPNNQHVTLHRLLTYKPKMIPYVQIHNRFFTTKLMISVSFWRANIAMQVPTVDWLIRPENKDGLTEGLLKLRIPMAKNNSNQFVTLLKLELRDVTPEKEEEVYEWVKGKALSSADASIKDKDDTLPKSNPSKTESSVRRISADEVSKEALKDESSKTDSPETNVLKTSQSLQSIMSSPIANKPTQNQPSDSAFEDGDAEDDPLAMFKKQSSSKAKQRALSLAKKKEASQPAPLRDRIELFARMGEQAFELDRRFFYRLAFSVMRVVREEAGKREEMEKRVEMKKPKGPPEALK